MIIRLSQKLAKKLKIGTLPVLGELIERAGLTCNFKGKMQINLLGEDYMVTVNEHDSFGESAFTLTLKKSK